MSPDDDNALTITKGSVKDYARCPADGNSKWVRPTADKKAEIYYALCDNESAPPLPGPWGKLYDFPVDLEAYAPVLIGDTVTGGDVPGVLIRTNQRQNSTLEDHIYEGIVEVTRRL